MVYEKYTMIYWFLNDIYGMILISYKKNELFLSNSIWFIKEWKVPLECENMTNIFVLRTLCTDTIDEYIRPPCSTC